MYYSCNIFYCLHIHLLPPPAHHHVDDYACAYALFGFCAHFSMHTFRESKSVYWDCDGCENCDECECQVSDLAEYEIDEEFVECETEEFVLGMGSTGVGCRTVSGASAWSQSTWPRMWHPAARAN